MVMLEIVVLKVLWLCSCFVLVKLCIKYFLILLNVVYINYLRWIILIFVMYNVDLIIFICIYICIYNCFC